MATENGDHGDERKKRILLVVDDDEHVVNLLKRALDKSFGEIITKKTVEEAARFLAGTAVTHVIGDKRAFESKVGGERFMAFWRRARPSIERVVMYTGADPLSVQYFPEVDAVVEKTVPLALLVEALRVKK